MRQLPSWLKNIDPTLLDAGLVDGANRRQLFRHVIFPLLAPVTTIVVIISVIDSLRAFPALDSDINVDIAKNLDAPMLLVTSARDRTVDEVASSIKLTCNGLTERGAEILCEMDADFSHRPDSLPLLRRACEQADLVIGSRAGRNADQDDQCHQVVLFEDAWDQFCVKRTGAAAQGTTLAKGNPKGGGQGDVAGNWQPEAPYGPDHDIFAWAATR